MTRLDSLCYSLIAFLVAAVGCDVVVEPRSGAPEPFGIIETYHPYMSRATKLLLGGDVRIWVRRGENVAASQDATRGSFLRANDALDRFCQDTGWHN